MSTKGTVLVIDDEQVIRDLFQRFLARRGYYLHTADTGSAGLREIEAIAPDIVFLDLKMPGIDGLEVLKKAKEIDKDLPVIILTGHGDLDSAIQSVRLGAYDFMQKPIENLEALLIDIDRAIESYHRAKDNRALTEELKTLNQRLLDANKELERKVMQRTQELQDTVKELQAAQKKIDAEIKIVSKVQKNLLPKELPHHKSLDIAALYKACAAVGGDYYDYMDMDNGELGFVVADVSGHGLPAAFVMTMVKIMLIHLNARKMPLDETLRMINKVLLKYIPTNNFVTMIYGILNLNELKFRYINAGHEGLIHVDPCKKILHPLGSKSPVLGVDEDIDFIIDTVQLHKGDKLIFYTDGITEAANSDYELFNDERLKETLTQNMGLQSKPLLERIMEDLSSYCGGDSFVDDITLMILGIS